ncbi:hypothetical protein SCHPADRAFT_911915 [Schizopora paradoxa]|uniref:Uncharacterized protein n=1 Tax=Schizopora paradoxa TaxID=27342 RepID=A0A0H2QWQ3_9AGAM|nr:hypothetical protein SCHPADRAFT_911915 [Schizopora paradoxa]
MPQILTDARSKFKAQHLRAFLDIAEVLDTATKHVRSTRITVRFTGVEKNARKFQMFASGVPPHLPGFM